MTDHELQQQRAHNWRIAGNPVRTVEDARSFVDDVGLCLMYRERSLPLVATFVGAYAGSSENLPDAVHAFADPRSKPATELAVRLLRERAAFEISLAAGGDLIVSATLFPFFYALLGDHNPKAAPKVRTQGAVISPLAITVFDAIQKHGPLNKAMLRERVGREMSDAALDRALNELWAVLKITRVDYREGQGAFWDVLYRWAADAVKEGINISVPEAISALVSKYLESAVAAGQEDIEQLLSRLTSRSKVREAVNALLAARELAWVPSGTKTLLRLAPALEPRNPVRRRPVHG
jgi:23S rRNA pseudouridine2605 synthase